MWNLIGSKLKPAMCFVLFQIVFLSVALEVGVWGDELQEIQFSRVPAINRTFECNANAAFSRGYFGKIPNLQSILYYYVTSIRQYNLTGSWALYSEENYEGQVFLSMDSNCLKQTDENSPPYKSMQCMGNPNADLLGLSLFPGDGGLPNPYGKESYIDNDQFSFTEQMCTAFWASTGATDWTIFSGSDFKGPSMCLAKRKNSKYGIGELDSVYIGSGYEGCNITSPEPGTLQSCKSLWTTSAPESSTNTGSGNLNMNMELIMTGTLSTLIAITAVVGASIK